MSNFSKSCSLLCISIFFFSLKVSAACGSSKDSRYQRALRILTLVLGAQAITRSVYTKPTSRDDALCASDTYLMLEQEPACGYHISSETFRDVLKEYGINIVRSDSRQWISTIEEGCKSPESLALQLKYLAYAAYEYAPLGEKEEANRAVELRAPLIFEALLRPANSKEITRLFKNNLDREEMHQNFDATRALQSATTEEQLINLAEQRELWAKKTFFSRSLRRLAFFQRISQEHTILGRLSNFFSR